MMPAFLSDPPERGLLATVYSHSRLASFEKCKKQFHYRYVEKRPVETESIEAFVGKRVHAVIEKLNHFIGRGLIPSLPKVLARFRSDWDEQYEPVRVRIVRAENPPDVYRDNGERCLANHYRRHYPFDRDESLGIEQHVGFALDTDGRYRVQGIVDRIVRTPDGAIEIHDYKTGRWVPTQQELDSDRQLALYQIGIAQRYGMASVRLVWHYLLRDQVRVSTRTPEQLDELRARTIELIDRVEAETEFEPTPSTLCSWCEFNDVCPAMAAKASAAADAAIAEAVALPAPPPAPRAVPALPVAAMERSREPAVPASRQLSLFS
jgi:putative RecB family exonuclease